MNQLIQFIINHWLLWLALVGIIILLIFEETKRKAGGAEQVSPQQATNLINHEGGVVVDVREVDAFQNGHLTAALNLPLSDLQQNTNKLNKYKSKPIILACNDGQISGKAAVLLKKAGFTKVYALSGGIAAWQKAGLPLVK
jgi:rhodanese-related sulfurtransferase